VNTGKVTVVSNGSSKSGALNPQAVFLGDTIGFTSSDLLNEGGVSTGIRAMNVSITNNFGLTLGTDPNGATAGLKVVISPITNLTAPANLENLTNVSTFAGSGASGNNNGASLSANFTSPVGVALNNQGALYVTDQSGLIRKVVAGSVTTLAGGGAASANPDGMGTNAYFGFPYGIVVNPIDGAIIVADDTLNRIRRITPAGMVTTIAGNGTAGGANGLGNAATFSGPAGVAIDSSGNIYVSEAAGDRIRKLVLTAGTDPSQAADYTVSTVAGTGVAGSTDGLSAAAQFYGPKEIALDGNGGLYVADCLNCKIRRVDLNSGAVVTIAGTGTAADLDANGSLAQFDRPSGIAWGNGALYVAESGGFVIRQISLAPGASPSSSINWTVQTLAGTAGTAGYTDGGGANALFKYPIMLTASASGSSLFVSDMTNHVIRRVTPTSASFPVGVINTIGGTSTEPVLVANADGVEAGNATGSNLPYMLYPGALAPGATSAAKLWSFNVPTGVTDFTFTVTVTAATPVPVPPDGGTGTGSGNAYVRTISGNPGASGHLNGPEVMATFKGSSVTTTDAAGDIFVADGGNNEIRRISAGGVVSTVAGNYTKSTGYVNGAGNVALFMMPEGIAVTPDGGTIFVADDGNNAIRRIVLTSGADPTNSANWTVTTIVGMAWYAMTPYPGTTTGDKAVIVQPTGLAYDPVGKTLYFSEVRGNRITQASYTGGDPSLAQNWLVSVVAGDTSGIYGASGQLNFVGSSARFTYPMGIALDGQNNIYVADEGNNVVRKITAGGNVATLAGSTSSIPGYADGLGASASFDYPSAVALDKAGDVFVADAFNHRIRAISPDGLVTTVAGTGFAGHIDGPGTSAEFSEPTGVSIQADGTLIVTSFTDYSIRAVSRSFANSTVGP
jgi:sugar lactone lactonase YvrE